MIDSNFFWCTFVKWLIISWKHPVYWKQRGTGSGVEVQASSWAGSKSGRMHRKKVNLPRIKDLFVYWLSNNNNDNLPLSLSWIFCMIKVSEFMMQSSLLDLAFKSKCKPNKISCRIYIAINQRFCWDVLVIYWWIYNVAQSATAVAAASCSSSHPLSCSTLNGLNK